MRITILGIVVFFTVIMVYSCSVTANVEKENSADLSGYKTFMWIDLMASGPDSTNRPVSFADISVHNSVNEELGQWSWHEVTENPDVLISYDILVEKDVERQNDPIYSRSFNRIYYNRFSGRWSSIYYPPQFLGYEQYQLPVKEVTFILTMMDAHTDKKVWMGWTTERLYGTGLSNLNINKNVKNIFKKANNNARP